MMISNGLFGSQVFKPTLSMLTLVGLASLGRNTSNIPDLWRRADVHGETLNNGLCKRYSMRARTIFRSSSSVSQGLPRWIIR
jgi:hypothetical protein